MKVTEYGDFRDFVKGKKITSCEVNEDGIHLYLSAANKGSKRTPEQREKMRRAQTGKKHSPEHIRRVAESKIGRACSEETKKKIAAAQRGIPRGPNSPEVRAKKSEAQKIAWIKRRQKLSA